MPKAWLVGGAIFVGLLLVSSVVLALLQREQSFEDGTPEKAVQDFLKAYADEDYARVYELWAEDLRKDCTRDDYIEKVVGSNGRLSDSRIRLTDTEYVGDDSERAMVLARVSRISSDGPFSTSESDHRQRYTLALEAGVWKFTAVPWPSAGCPPIKQAPASPTGRSDHTGTSAV